ncbi:BTB/POZ domain-containing protein [Ditylenchus destructor]|nr:BTB/POZ domain-containing protein [Ditylenchus destructor]
MSQDSFIFNFHVKAFETAQEFPKSNVVELEGSKWYLGIEKKGINDRISLSYRKILDICLSCERGTPSGIYLVNLALILRGSLIDVLFTRTYYFKPLDLELHCFKIDYNYLLDNDNGFIDENGEGKIMAEISVKRVDDKEILELDANQQEESICPQELNGSINLQGGHRMLVNKELLSRHSKYFDNIFNNENFVESSQESIDLTDFTYNQFRLLHKHIYDTRAQFTNGSLEFRLKSKDGDKEFQKLRTLPKSFKEFQRLCSLDDVRDYSQQYANNLHQRSEDSSKNLLKETLCMFDDLKQMSAFAGLIFCVFTDYVRREQQTVSAENIEDLLSVGSYFQISKIVDSCKEFLSRNTFYPDYSVRSRLELAEKYNLTSVTVPAINPVNPLKHQWNTDSAWLTPTVLVQFTFLDTRRRRKECEERVCSVKFIDGMTIQTLLSNAFIELNYKRNHADCFRPSEYKVEHMRISDPETYSEVEYQRKNIDDNPALMLDYAHSSRIYNFVLRRIPNPIEIEFMGLGIALHF